MWTLPLEAITEICRRYKVRELSLFGSAARGEMREASDIGLMVEFLPDARIGFMALNRMERELAAAVGRKVDLVSRRGLKPRTAPYVLRDAKPIYAAFVRAPARYPRCLRPDCSDAGRTKPDLTWILCWQ
jgi:predicted nucleotidyltransferase